MKRTPLKRKTRLSPISKRRKEELKEYSRLRKEFLGAHPVCEVWLIKNQFIQMPDGSYRKMHFGDVGRVEWKAHYLIETCGAPASTDVHHVKKRGKHYLDVSSWMAVSRQSHQWIHDHPKEAREQGFLF